MCLSGKIITMLVSRGLETGWWENLMFLWSFVQVPTQANSFIYILSHCIVLSSIIFSIILPYSLLSIFPLILTFTPKQQFTFRENRKKHFSIKLIKCWIVWQDVVWRQYFIIKKKKKKKKIKLTSTPRKYLKQEHGFQKHQGAKSKSAIWKNHTHMPYNFMFS